MKMFNGNRQSERFMQRVNLRYNIDGNWKNTYGKSEPPSRRELSQFAQDRNAFLNTQNRNDLVDIRATAAPRIEANGSFYKQVWLFKSPTNDMPPNAGSFLQEQLEKIEKSEGGKELLTNLNNLLAKKKDNIEFSNCSDNAFGLDKDNSPTLYINPWKNVTWIKNREGKLESFVKTPLIQSRSILPIYDPDASELEMKHQRKIQVANIKEGLTPFHLVLAHELTHFKNFLNSEDLNISYPANSDRVLQKSILGEHEEHRTVHGSTNTTEQKYRQDLGEPLRYLYQKPVNGGYASFREPVSSIKKNVYRSSDISNENFQKTLDRISDYLSYLGSTPIQPKQRRKLTPQQKAEAEHTQVNILGSLYKQYYPQASDNQLFGYIKEDLTDVTEEKWRDFTKRNWEQFSDNKIDRMQNRKNLLAGLDSTLANVAKHDNLKFELKNALNKKLSEHNRLNSIEDQIARTEAQFKEMLGFGKRMNVDSAQKFPSSYDDARKEVSLLNGMDLGGQKAELYLQRLKANLAAIIQNKK